MVWYDNCKTVSVEAGSAITAFRFIVLASDGQVDHAITAQGVVDGIAGETQATVGGTLPMVVPDGCLAMVEAGAAITRGALVSTNGSGKAIAHVAALNNKAIGRAWEAANADGDIITIQFVHKATDGGT